ncbi:MAG: SocA family protein [Puniceicoccales bacterium]|nr:SocA family protein [Puniceicoccales bacterium]
MLFNLLYFIDFDFYELYEEPLMGLRYVKMPQGQVPTPLK